ncbi:MAG: hypothetical protein HZC37_29985 [Burkholderiales bacterium]|nr:hypothetical protein [Burkholderiales bacterium]
MTNHSACMRVSRCLAFASALLLASCGGSGGEGSEAAPPPPPPPVPSPCDTAGTAYVRLVKATTVAGLGGGAAIAGCTGAIESPLWTQTSGPAAAALSSSTQTLFFETPVSGRYSFRVDFRDPDGVARSEDFGFDVAPGSLNARIALRTSQSVRMGGNVSVRAWPTPSPGDAVSSITWAQIEGPAVTFDVTDPYVALFVAPQVTRDTPIRLRATLTTRGGQTASDDVLVLVERHAQAATNDTAALWAGDHVSRVHAYRPAGPYAGALERCVYDSALRTDNLCPLSQLPFLAQETVGVLPTIEQVMNRVVVSHDWAGRNFETFLREHDARGDFRRMLMSVTAVVIGVQVRPSFYYAVTGAIYLDADNFWLTPEERDTVNEAPDYRSGFGNALQYTTLWRYVRGSTSLFQYYDPRQRLSRGTGALLDEAGWLMLHELGHALDFLPPAAYASLNGALSPWGNISPRYQAGQLASDTVPASFPLVSAEMAALGQVRFLGVTANATQTAYTPAQVAAFFSPDLATDDYAYASRREDVAMALEEFLMQRWLGVRRDFAIVPRPGAGATGSTLIVQWGQRGRIGEPALRPRLLAIVQQLVPWLPPAEVDQLPAPLPMRVGDSWTGNLVLPGAPPTSPRLEKAEPTLQELWLLEQAQRRRLRLQPEARPLPKGAGAPAR